jgi:predicted ATPase
VGDRPGLGPVAHTELGQDVGDVDAGGLDADVEGLGDLAVGASVRDQRQDLQLSWGEAQLRGGRWRRWGCGLGVGVRTEGEAGAAGQRAGLTLQPAGAKVVGDRPGLPQGQAGPVACGMRGRQCLGLPEAGVGGGEREAEGVPGGGGVRGAPSRASRVAGALDAGPFGFGGQEVGLCQPAERPLGRRRPDALEGQAVAAAPLVTLVGPGGVGKTRLAQEVAALQEAVWWVDLAPLRDPGAVPYAVADAVGIDLLPGTLLPDALGQWARRAHGLLVLDNCEHLLAAVARLADELLASASGLSLLATSRERLAIGGEQVLDVPPLEVAAPDAADGGPAVRLFLDRAQAADPAVAPSPPLLRRVADICRALDGLPLAIELAAARIGTLTVDDLADRLHTRFELLRTGRGGADSRHQALEAVVDWSFELLGGDEQRLFLRLSVFAAAFDIAAAEAVVADDDLPAGRVADLVARLAEQSMLTRPGPSGIGRYRMLETLRAYAASRLPDVEAGRLRRRHAGFMVDLAERAEVGLYGPEEKTWAQEVERWLDDLRAAWSWARDADDVDLAVRLAAALTRYAYWRLRSDLLAWGTWAAAAVPAHPRLAVAYAAAAAAAWGDGRLQAARDLARRGVEAGGGPAARAAAAPLEAVGDAAMLTGDLAAALEAYRQVAAIATPGDPAELAIATANQALTLAYAGDDQAARSAEEAVTAARTAANPTAIAMARFAEGEAFADIDPARASAALDEAQRRAREVGNRFVAGTALTATVALRARHGPPEEALALFRDAIDHWRTSRNRALLVTTLRNLVILLARTGRDEAAAALAATLQEAAPSRSYGTEAARITTALAAVRRRLGDAAYDRAWTAGAARTLEEAADHAMRLLDPGPGTA